MDFGEIIPYIITALGGGSAGWLVNWKWGRRKEAANVKSDEIETMKKAMEDSIGRDAAALWLAEYYGEEDEHE